MLLLIWSNYIQKKNPWLLNGYFRHYIAKFLGLVCALTESFFHVRAQNSCSEVLHLFWVSDLVAFYDNLIQISLSISESQDNVRKSVLVQQSQQSQPVKALWKIAIENFGTFSVRGYLLLFYSFRLIKIDLKDIFNSFGLLLRLNSKHRGGIQPSNCQKF